MNKKRILLFLTLLTIILTISTVNAADNDINQTNTNGTIHIVDGSSVNQMDDDTIQQAIDKANPGDTILITGKNYVHCHIIINKQLNIMSEVNTTMSPCPSHKTGSGSLGVFYITAEASNSVIKGFIINNDLEDDGYTVPPYGIYSNGASNLTISDCTINSKYGEAILIKNGKNNLIINNILKKSINGIKIENTDNTIIAQNTIANNSLSGVKVSEKVNNTSIDYNIINGNLYGINVSSSENLNITNNKIYDNRNNKDQSRATEGVGIYTNCNITNNIIRGNYISENGMYGIFNDYRARNIKNEYIQIVDQNLLRAHKQRTVFTCIYVQQDGADYDYNATTDTYYQVEHGTGHYDTGTGMIFLWSNIFYEELFCGGTSYAPGVLRISDPYKDLIVGNISQITPGVYKFTFNYKANYNNGSVATGLNAVDMVFYLNKNNTIVKPVSGDIYRNVTIINGTAIVDFRNETFLESGNNVSIVGPGTGSFTGGNRPYAFLAINDIPTNESSETEIVQEDLIKTYGDNDDLIGLLMDKNANPIAGQHVNIKLTRISSGASKTYTTTTDYKGQYKLTINLAPGTYTAESTFNGNDKYESSNASSKIIISKANITSTILTADDLNKVYGDDSDFIGILSDINGNVIAGQHVDVKLTRISSGASKTYTTTTDYKGQYKLTINLAPGTYTAESTFNGNDKYESSSLVNKINVLQNVSNFISPNMSNSDIQFVLDSIGKYSNVVFSESNYTNISLNVNKPLNLVGNNSVLYGVSGSVFTLNSDDVNISGFTIVPYEGDGISLGNVSNIHISDNVICNVLDSVHSYDYSRGYKVLPGNGVSVVGSGFVFIENNSISNFENGVYLLDSDSVNISSNLLIKNNYGVNYDYGVSNTFVYDNNISLSVGNYTLDEPEGPLGYGIFINNSANNLSVIGNDIVDNYMGILIDSDNSTGIRILSNLINENALEGVTFWKHYNLTDSSVYPVVEDNAIYNNAKGPSMMILGEMSANPEGIYGPGEWNDSLKLFIGPNWYGTNTLVTWDLNGTVGAGSMCPRIKTTTIVMNLTYVEPGVYNVDFYKNGSLAVNLPVFTIYSTFNNISSDDPVVIVNGSGVLKLDKNSFNNDYNLIEISAGPLDSEDRIYYVIFNYLIPNSEYPQEKCC